MTRARQNANVTAAVGRNMVINGAMNVAQRSASVTGIGASINYFTCDRWKINTAASAGRLTMTQTADGPIDSRIIARSIGTNYGIGERIT